MSTLRAAFAAAGLLLATACNSVHDRLSRAYLTPSPEWLVEPADLGLDAEAFDIDVGKGSLTGWLLRAPDADGRTVLLFHGSSANVSMLHPYYTFLVHAGLNVCVFDYRGYGRSRGEPSVRGLFHDTRDLLDWLERQPGVDKDRIGYYGLSIGSVAALFTARTQSRCRALVLENVPSPRDAIAADLRKEGAIGVDAVTGFVEFAGLPEGTEPSENAAQLAMPSLWIGGTDEPREELRATLRAYWEMRGDKQLWILPDTGHAPNSLLTHDGEYQRVVARFLRTALGGAPDRFAVKWWPDERPRTPKPDWNVEVAAEGGPDHAPRAAVAVCALDADANPTWGRVMLDQGVGNLRLALAQAPAVVGAMDVGDAEPQPDGQFIRRGTPLSRTGAWYESHRRDFDSFCNGLPDPGRARAIAETIRDGERAETFPPLLETQLAGVFAAIGLVLGQTNSAEDRALGIVWLRRAIHAAPEHPERHYWPGIPYVAGFASAQAVEQARELLRRLEGSAP